MSPKVKEAVLDFMRSENVFNVDGSFNHEAYAAECRLFGEHFKNMSEEEMVEYKEFVQWLDSSGMIKSLTEMCKLDSRNLV